MGLKMRAINGSGRDVILIQRICRCTEKSDYFGSSVQCCRPARIRGVRFVQAPAVLRHFTARFEPIGGALLAE
jgi:tryptophanase